MFLIALVLNIKVTLDDPFVMMSEQAIATGSSTNGTNGTNGTDGTDGTDGTGTVCPSPTYVPNAKITASLMSENNYTRVAAYAELSLGQKALSILGASFNVNCTVTTSEKNCTYWDGGCCNSTQVGVFTEENCGSPS